MKPLLAPKASLNFRFLFGFLTIFILLAPILARAPANSPNQDTSETLPDGAREAMKKLAAQKAQNITKTIQLNIQPCNDCKLRYFYVLGSTKYEYWVEKTAPGDDHWMDDSHNERRKDRELRHSTFFRARDRTKREYRMPIKTGKRKPPRFEEFAQEMFEKMPDKGKALLRWIKAHPYLTVAVLTPVIVKGSLVVVGFHVAGVQAGSMAALIQSWIGNVAAGSWFATFQSLGATYTWQHVMAHEGLMGLAFLIDNLGGLAYKEAFGEKEIMEVLTEFYKWVRGIKVCKDLVVYNPHAWKMSLQGFTTQYRFVAVDSELFEHSRTRRRTRTGK